MVSTVVAVRRIIALLVSLVLTLMWVPGLLVSAAPAYAAGTQLVDGFEIDGNLLQDSAANADWQTVLNGPSATDPVGNAETSVFQTSSKEDDDPTTWAKGTSNVDPKDDIGGVYTYSHADLTPPPHVFFYFGWDRADGSGTDFYKLELNQNSQPTTNSNAKLNPGNLLVPDRTIGDLRFSLHDQGSGVIALDQVDRWTGSSWTCFYGSLASCDHPLGVNPAGFYSAANGGVNPPTPPNWTATSPNPTGVTTNPKNNGHPTSEQFVETA